MKLINKTNLILLAALISFNSCAGLMGMMGGMGGLMGGAGATTALPGIKTPSFQGLTGQESDGMMLAAGTTDSSVGGKIGYVVAASQSKDLSDSGKLYGLFEAAGE